MKQKTAMSRLSEELKKARDYINGFPGEYYAGQQSIYDSIIEVIEDEFKPEEKQQIVDAYNKSWDNANNLPAPTYGEDYYTQTYQP